ncbi:MAG: leucine--tRNA ligase [Alphaproteobacteria bacterium CG_4_10_14_0_8_um_filter_53_9]|nr:MAG: leucine--tRNA ligase [Alphaproteobacteria bacterium CG_4_10_14_0_8_um_filter_53_9]
MNTALIPPYTPSSLEADWQKTWFDNNVFEAHVNPEKQPFYVLEMLPYPSGQLHMGHVRNYTLGDVLARFKRAQGFNVMHPMGWDSFGLPAENAAIKRGIHPGTWTLENIAEMKAVMKKFGWSYDWSKEVTTCLPSYYGHQQALFLDFFAKGLVYKKEALVNWDPIDQTVLANEQVVDGKGWRSGAPVERKLLSQWFLKITHYADALLDDLTTLPGWPDRVKTMQVNWIGKSQGMKFDFTVQDEAGAALDPLTVFSTRPDTLYGATFCAVAPEHPLAKKAAETSPEIAAFIAEASRMGTAQEIIDRAEKKGALTPYVAIHPLTGDKLPIFVANFVLMTYGTGAIMAVPAHDERDHAFATKYNLPITPVVSLPEGHDITAAPYTGDGEVVNSPLFNGKQVDEAIATAIAKAEAEGWGEGQTQYRLRDWGVGRQRYWGCPIPFIHCPDCGVVPVPRDQLPVKLPEDCAFDGAGNPLDKHPTWKHVDCPSCGAKAERETDTMDTFMDSSWYFLRYLCPEADEPLDKTAMDYWMKGGVNQYIGGIEHAVLHLLYSRFFVKALRDMGKLPCGEPFAALLCQGMLIGNSYQKADGTYVYPSQVVWKDGKAFEKDTGEALTVLAAEKISKSKNNGDSPDELLARYGADTLRLFMLFTAPPERDLEWSEQAIDGAWRFLGRVWTLAHKVAAADALQSAPNEALNRKIHQTILRVTKDIERFHYNTMVAACMELMNDLNRAAEEGLSDTVKFGAETLVRLLNPAVPHITEHLWQVLGHTDPLYAAPWPVADEAAAQEDEITLVVQVNGKVRGKLVVPADISAEDALAMAKALDEVQPWIEGKALKKELYVPGRLVTLAVA